MDRKQGVYYALGFDDMAAHTVLLGVDVETGKLVVNVTTPFHSTGSIRVTERQLDFDPSTGGLLAGDRRSLKHAHHVGWLDTVTGNFTSIAEISKETFPLPDEFAPSAFDPHSRQLLLTLADEGGSLSIYAVNVDNGDVIKVEEDTKNNHDMMTMAYDVKTKRVYGLGIPPASSTLDRVLVALEPKKKSFHFRTVAEVSDWGEQLTSSSAIDEENRLLSWIGQPAGANASAPYHLVSVNVDSGAVVSSPVLCVSKDLCPQSIERA